MRIAVPPPDLLTITDLTGRILLRITHTGAWSVAPADAPEAARIFAATVANELLRLVPGRVFTS